MPEARICCPPCAKESSLIGKANHTNGAESRKLIFGLSNLNFNDHQRKEKIVPRSLVCLLSVCFDRIETSKYRFILP
jgi:hypothetical protein